MPPGSPNYFLLNITGQQVLQVQAFLEQHQVKPETFYLVARVRLIGINHQPANPAMDNSLNRELNLT